MSQTIEARMLWWVLGLVGALLILGIGGVAAKVTTTAEELAATKARQSNTEQRLERIESKIDAILERLP